MIKANPSRIHNYNWNKIHGRLTAKFQKNLYRPHKAYIFLSIFSFLYIGFLGFLCYNGKGGIDYESEYIKI